MRDPTYTYCRELLAPSTVDRAVSLSFTRVGVSNLALARGNVLELYEVQLVARPDGSGGGEAADDYTYRASGGEDFGLPMIQDDAQQRRRLGNKYTSSSTKRPQLHLVSRWTLHGRIMDMQAVRGGSGGGSGGGRQRVDRLLLSFADAKMSLVAFDRATQSITTESIHYYEHDQLKQCAFNDAQTCDLRMDPDGRCVAMRIYDDQLAILPLAAPGDAPASASAPSGQSFVVDLRADGVDVRNVRDFAFLNGYLEPTLVLLHEQVPMWPGVIESARDSSVVTVVSLDLSRRCVSRLNAAGRLPYDCQTLVPVPEPIGGVLVLATNSVTHVVNGAVSCISVLNSLAMHGMGIELRATIDTTNEALGLVLDPHRSACVLVGRSTAALWTQHGFVFLLRLDGDGRLVKRIVATQISGADPRADALPPIAHEWDDIGVLPSCAVEVRIASDDGGDENSGDGGDGSGSDNALDGLLIFVGGASGRSLLLGVDQAERSLCPEPGSDSGAAMDIDAPMDIDSLRLTVHDEILGTGPVVDMEVGSLGAEDLELVTCGGNEWRGCLRVQRRHVQPEVVASFDLPGAPVRGVWTVRCLKEYRIGGVMQAADAGSLADMSDSFVVLSRDHATTVLSGGDELQQLDRTGFYTDGPTIEAGEILGSTRVVQVHARGLRLVNALGRETQSLLFDSGEAAVAAEISDPYVLVRMADDSFTMFEAPIDSGELREIIVPEALRAGSGNVVYASLFDDACRVLETNREHVDRNREAIREQLGAALAGAAGSGSSGSMPGMIGDLDDLYAETGHSQRRKPGAGRFTARKQRKRTENNPGSRDDNGEDDENDDDDFDALYDEDEGEDAGADGSVPSGKAPAESPGDTADNADGEGVRGESPMYALVALANGDLSVFRLPHFDRVWTTARFDSLADTLVDTLAASAPMAEQESRAESRVDQFRLVQLGGDDISTALLVVLTTAGELAVYRAFSHCSPEYAKAAVEQAAPAAAAGTAAAAAACGDDTGLALRFTRVVHDVLAYEPDYERRVQRVQARQTRVFDAWTRRDRERMAREAKVQARAKQHQHRDAAAAATAVDWGESDEDDEAAEGGREQPAADGGAHDAAASESDAAKDGDGDGEGDGAGGGDDAAMGGEEQMPDLDLIDAQIGDRAVAPTRKITVLGNLGGYAAVFVAALQPAIVLVGAKRYARVHPVRVPARLPAVLARITKDADAAGLLTPWQPIVGTARFHSAACPHGLIALTQAGTLVIGALPAPASAALRGGVEFDAPWPVRCLPVGTRHVGLSALGGVVFHRPSGSYAVAAAVPEPFALKEPNCEVAARQALEDGIDSVDDTQVIPEHKRRDVRTTSAPPLQPHAHVDLLSPVTWETVDSYALERNEHVAALESLELESAQSVGGRRAVVCVGTGFVLGEDVASRGRVLIFDVIDVVPLPGRPQTNRRLKLLCQEELRGTVTALGELRGNLAVSVGSKVFVRSLQRNEQLVSVAFLDCATWVRSLAGLNSLLLVGDLTAGLCLAGFQDEGPTRIQVLARDASSHLPIEHAEYAVLGHHMQLLAADTLGALHFFSYAPHDAQSAGGQRLLRRGEFNLRSRVAAVRRLVGMPRLGTEPSQPQHVCLVATAAGAVHAVSMVSEKTFKRLHRITTQMVHAVAPLAALNPREFRAVPLHRRQHHAPRRTVLDADLLAPLFAHGPLERQRDAAQRNGTTPDRVLRDIVETERAFAFF